MSHSGTCWCKIWRWRPCSAKITLHFRTPIQIRAQKIQSKVGDLPLDALKELDLHWRFERTKGNWNFHGWLLIRHNNWFLDKPRNFPHDHVELNVIYQTITDFAIKRTPFLAIRKQPQKISCCLQHPWNLLLSPLRIGGGGSSHGFHNLCENSSRLLMVPSRID